MEETFPLGGRLKAFDSGAGKLVMSSQVVVRQSGILHDAALRPWLEILVAVNGDNCPASRRGVATDVVRARDAG